MRRHRLQDHCKTRAREAYLYVLKIRPTQEFSNQRFSLPKSERRL